MKKWVLISIVVVIVMIVAIVYFARAFMPPPIPEPPTVADAPLAIHINEIDLSTSGIVLISIDNFTRDPIVIDGRDLSTALSGHMRLFDPYNYEYVWSNSRGAVSAPFSADNYWQWNGSNGQPWVRIEPGRTENFTLVVSGDINLMPQSWVARFRGTPDRLIYVVDGEIRISSSQSEPKHAMQMTAKGEAAYKPRP